MKKTSKKSRVKKAGASKASGSGTKVSKKAKSKKPSFDFGALKVLNLKKPVKVYGCFEADPSECSGITGAISCTTVSVGCYTC